MSDKYVLISLQENQCGPLVLLNLGSELTRGYCVITLDPFRVFRFN